MIDYNAFSDRSVSNAEKYTLRETLFGTTDVIPMWVADMDIQTPPCIRDAVKRRAAHEVYGYEEMPDSAFEAQIQWIQKRHHYQVKREWMLYSHSVVASISVAIQTFSNPGDKVIVQTPVYPPFFGQVSLNGREVLKNPLKKEGTDDYTFDIEDLRSKIDAKTKLLLLCSPHNPVGRVWKREELEAIATLCLEHDIMVFADEIHSDLVYAPHKHIPFASLSKEVEAITITAMGPGKTFNVAGLATSTIIIADARKREAYDKVYQAIHFAQGNVFGHAGFEAAYKEGEAWLEGVLTHLRLNVQALKNMLQSHSDKIELSIPEGTYLAWLDCSKMGLSEKELRRFFIESAALGLSPGLSFSKEGKQHMRLNFAVPSQTMNEAIAQLDLALSSYEDQGF